MTPDQAAQLARIESKLDQMGTQPVALDIVSGRYVTRGAQPGEATVAQLWGNVMEAATATRPDGSGTLEQRVAAEVWGRLDIAALARAIVDAIIGRLPSGAQIDAEHVARRTVELLGETLNGERA